MQDFLSYVMKEATDAGGDAYNPWTLVDDAALTTAIGIWNDFKAELTAKVAALP